MMIQFIYFVMLCILILNPVKIGFSVKLQSHIDCAEINR